MAARNLHEAIIRERNKIFDREKGRKRKKKKEKENRRDRINGRVDNTCTPDVSFVVLDLIAAQQS